MKKFLIKAVLPVSMVVCAVAVASCSQDELLTQTKEQSEEGVLSNPREIRNYLKTLPLAPMMTRANGPITPNDGTPLPVEEEDPVVETQGVLDGIPGNWVKTTRHYKIKQTFDENFLFDPTSDVVYPGCVLKGGTIANGTYAMITSHKTGDVTFSISLSPANPREAHETSATIPNIRKSEYQEVWNKWATMDWKESPVTTIQSVEKINSQEELVTKLGVAVTAPVANGSINLGFNFNKKKNHILARLIQKHFTVSTDAPKKGTIFESIDKDALDGYQPVYISSINYGRIIYLSIETDEKERNINEAIEFALNKIKGVDVNVSADQAVNYRKMLAKSDVHITVLGGGKTIQQEILKGDIDSFQRFLAADIPMEQMYPISFSLRYAKDNSICRVVSRGEYDIVSRTFVPEFKKMFIEMSLSGLRGSESSYKYEKGDEYEMYGDAWMTFNDQKVGDIFNINRQNYIFVKKGNDFTNVDGKRCILSIEKPDGISFQDFMRSRVRIYTHLYDNDEPSKDKDYGETYQEFYVSDILATHKNGEHKFSVVGHGKGIATETQFKISDIYFK